MWLSVALRRFSSHFSVNFRHLISHYDTKVIFRAPNHAITQWVSKVSFEFLHFFLPPMNLRMAIFEFSSVWGSHSKGQKKSKSFFKETFPPKYERTNSTLLTMKSQVDLFSFTKKTFRNYLTFRSWSNTQTKSI